MKCTRLKSISDKRLGRLNKEIPLREALAKRCGGAFIVTMWHRGFPIMGVCAGGHCEICGGVDWRGLQPHEVISRGRRGKLSLTNSLMACQNCHDHSKYRHGLVISIEEGLSLIARLNKEHEVVTDGGA